MYNRRKKKQCVTRLKVGDVYARYPFKNCPLFEVIKKHAVVYSVRNLTTGELVAREVPFQCYKIEL